MTAESYPRLLALVEGREDFVSAAMRSTLAISFVLHLLLIGVIGIVRLPASIQRPASSYQVSLVSLSAPRPAPQPPKLIPVTKVTKPAAPAPRVEVPKAAPVAKPVERRRAGLLPELSKPAEQPARPLTPNPNEIRNLLGKLNVPEIPASAPTPAKPMVTPEPPVRRSVSEELESQLQRMQEAPVPATAPVVPTPKPAEAPATAALKKPATMITVPGVASGFSQYLTAVQNKISRLWIAPPVDTTGQAFEVVIRFRLHRSGAVSDVTVERSSGNDYYDAAGKRAVLSAYPLPPFPQDMTESSLDAHFSFAVGQPPG
jgi:colicin import membrane protein